MKNLEPIVAGHFFDMRKSAGQSGLVGQVAVGHHPKAAIAGQVFRSRSDEPLPQLWFGASARVEWRVHHHRVDEFG